MQLGREYEYFITNYNVYIILPASNTSSKTNEFVSPVTMYIKL